jgi:nucleoside-diphosphate-sugar epimerase
VIFVTGSSGLVGSHLLYALAEKGDKVRALYRSQESLRTIEHLFAYYNQKNSTSYTTEHIEWIKGDILDVSILDDATSNVNIVYHCAAIVTFLKSDFHTCMKVNRKGTANVVNACLRNNVSKLCYVSSTAALGRSKETVSEDTKWKSGADVSGYSVSKHSAEKEVFRGAAEGLKVSIVNPCVILGPGDWDKGSLTILKAAKNGLSFYTTGSNAIVDARDVANVLILLAEAEESEEKYLLIGENVSFKKLFTMITERLKTKSPKYKLNAPIAKAIAFILENGLRFFGIKSPLTLESMQSAYKEVSYSNQKVKDRFNYSFFTLEQSIDNAVKGRFHD